MEREYSVGKISDLGGPDMRLFNREFHCGVNPGRV